MSQKRRLVSALINLTLAVGELFVLLNYGFGWLGTMGAKGWDTFRFYTNDSNILLGIACLVYGVADLLVLRHPEKKIPKAISLFSVGCHSQRHHHLLNGDGLLGSDHRLVHRL
jgi:hypothetical protein